MNRKSLTIGLMSSCVMALVAGPQTRAAFAAPAGGDAVTVWNANAGAAATAACIAPLDDPFHESRIYAMMHVAIHDALNAIDRRSQPYTFNMQGNQVLLRMPQLLRRHEMSWSRSSVNSLSSSSPRLASLQALQASRPPIPRPLPQSPTIRPRRRVSHWDRPRRRRSSP